MGQEARKTKAEQGFADQLEAAPETLPGTSDWARNLRETGRQEYLSPGLPHRRVEEWKYTDLAHACAGGLIRRRRRSGWR